MEKTHIGFFLLKPDTIYWVNASPNKIYEYLFCGVVPVVRADIDDAEEISECGLLFDRDTPENDILNRVIKLIEHPSEVKSLMRKAVDLSRKFTFESAGPNYLKLYKSLIGDEKVPE
jgi:hypothetical protein